MSNPLDELAEAVKTKHHFTCAVYMLEDSHGECDGGEQCVPNTDSPVFQALWEWSGEYADFRHPGEYIRRPRAEAALRLADIAFLPGWLDAIAGDLLGEIDVL